MTFVGTSFYLSLYTSFIYNINISLLLDFVITLTIQEDFHYSEQCAFITRLFVLIVFLVAGFDMSDMDIVGVAEEEEDDMVNDRPNIISQSYNNKSGNKQ